jgi:hypothetical protein
MSNLPTHRHSIFDVVVAAGEDRATVRRYGAIQKAAFLQRAHDVARRDLALCRMADLTDATRHGLAEGDAIVSDLARRIEKNPLAGVALSGLAEDGIDGLREQLRSLRSEM